MKDKYTNIRPHILLVEDEAMARSVGKVTLEKMGFLVSTVNCGEDAISSVKHNAYSAIFMDIGLPQINGIKAAQEIRKIENAQQLPPTLIFALTAHTEATFKLDYKTIGINEYIEKPLSGEKIQALVDQYPELLISKKLKTMKPQQNAIDINAVINLFGGDKKSAVTTIKKFLDSLTDIQQDLDKKFNNHEKTSFMKSIHKLTGSTSYVGATNLHTLSQKIETEGKDKSIEDLTQLYSQLVSEMSRIKSINLDESF